MGDPTQGSFPANAAAEAAAAEAGDDASGEDTRDAPESNLPGSAVVHVKTWGCGHNNSDGEYMAGLLDQYGYTLTDDESVADLWVPASHTTPVHVYPSMSRFKPHSVLNLLNAM